MKVIIIAEKPSVGRELAKVFGATTRKDGYIEGKGYSFTWAFGHLLQLAPPQEYGFIGWRRQHLPMLPNKFKLSIRKVKTKDGFVEDPGVRKQLDIIKKLFDEATEIIVATDAGREGELIFRYIYYFLKCKKPFKRLWISSQTDEAIKEGFRNLKPGTDYDTLFNSAHCRSESDWLVGMNATQALSISAGSKSVLSLGRVQTPTLAMVCARFLENKSFVPQTFYQISIQLDKEGQLFKAISLANYKTKAEAQEVFDKVENVASGFAAGGNITAVEAKPRKEPPPLLHDLSSLQQEGNKKNGFTADQTLNLLQNLYESKLVSYPRTGSRYIGDDVFLTVPALISALTEHPTFGNQANFLQTATLNKRSVNAKKVTDHHAILPTGVKPYNLSKEHQAIYDMVAGRMLEAFHQEIGRAVREIQPDGKYGPIYFIHYNPKWSEKNTLYPLYTKSKNKAFVEACNELLSNKLITQQWNEEADRKDPLITLQKQYKAFSYYHLNDGRVVGLWKNALTAISTDNGKTWPENASRAPGFVNSNAKIWGQKTADGNFATVYNPSEYRWPLAISTSKNGLDYTNLLLINGEVAPMRYGGNYKSYGPQYVRGIIEGNGKPTDGKLWVTYSMNKEDIWVSSIPLPVSEIPKQQADDDFSKLPPGKELALWNIYSPLWAPVKVENKALVLKDKDLFDYAKAERVFPASSKVTTQFSITPQQDNFGLMEIELQDAKGMATVRLTFDSTGTLSAKAGARYKSFMKYKAGESYDIKIKLDAFTRFYTITINGKEALTSLAFQPVAEVSRIVFRTGAVRRFPDVDTPADQAYDLPKAGESEKNDAVYAIKYLKTGKW